MEAIELNFNNASRYLLVWELRDGVYPKWKDDTCGVFYIE